MKKIDNGKLQLDGEGQPKAHGEDAGLSAVTEKWKGDGGYYIAGARDARAVKDWTGGFPL
jgi:hypothetical protein